MVNATSSGVQKTLENLNKNHEYIVSVLAPKDPQKQTSVQSLITSVTNGPAYHTLALKYDLSKGWIALNTGILVGNGSEIVDARTLFEEYAASGSTVIAQKTDFQEDLAQQESQPYGTLDLARLGLKNRDKMPILGLLQTVVSLIPDSPNKEKLEILSKRLKFLPSVPTLTYGDLKNIRFAKSESGQEIMAFVEESCETALSALEDKDLPGEYCTELVLESLEEKAEIKQKLNGQNPWEVTPSELLEAQQLLAQEKPQEFSLITLVNA